MKKEIVKIIFDTDIGGDCDDAGALALLNRLCDKGEAELIAVTSCYDSPYVAGCIDSINHFYKRSVPVGINYEYKSPDMGGVYAKELCLNFPNDYSEKVYEKGKIPDTIKVLRKALAQADDNSITFVATGTFHSMARLVKSEGDEISPLTGRELIKRKIKRTIVMAGRFFESWPMEIYHACSDIPLTWEWNVKCSGKEVANTALDLWEGEIVLSSYEIGNYIKTLVDYPSRAEEGDPVARAYYVHNRGDGRASWDLTAMLEAIRPGEYWNYHDYGKIYVDDDLVTHIKKEQGAKHTYLLPKVDYEDIRKTLDDIIDGK